jgi:hypothetical protein
MKTVPRSDMKSVQATIAEREVREPREFRVCPRRRDKGRVPVAVCEKCKDKEGCYDNR